MKRTMRVLGIALLTAFATACGRTASAPDPTAADRAAIDQVRLAYQSAFSAGDAVGIGSLYAVDGVDMPSNEPTRHGRAAIVTAIQTTFTDAMPGTMSATMTPTDTQVMGDVAVEHGAFHSMMTPMAGGDMMMVDGRYVMILRRQAGTSWKVILSIDNAAAPMTMPAAMPVKK